MKPLAIDLYCGLGGWSNGLIAEGWHCIGFDIERHEYGGERYPGSLVIQDVLTLDGARFKDAALIVASPPCQEFSYMAMPWTRAKQIAKALRATRFAAADANEQAPPIRPMSVSGRAGFGSSSGGASRDLCRAGISKHGQPREPGAHGPDASGNPAKLGAPIERVEGPHLDFPEGYRGSRTIAELNALFNACFRIQREASAAAGRHIPMVVENVRGAEPWVGRAKWRYGSFYLWGDLPALMPTAMPRANVSGQDWNRFNATGETSPYWRMEGLKNPGFRFDGSGKSFQSESVARHIRDGAPHTAHPTNPAEGRKYHGDWFDDPNCPSRQGGMTGRKQPGICGPRRNGNGNAWIQNGAAAPVSRSPARKAASARIAKIPETLARHIARVYKPVSQ